MKCHITLVDTETIYIVTIPLILYAEHCWGDPERADTKSVMSLMSDVTNSQMCVKVHARSISSGMCVQASNTDSKLMV